MAVRGERIQYIDAPEQQEMLQVLLAHADKDESGRVLINALNQIRAGYAGIGAHHVEQALRSIRSRAFLLAYPLSTRISPSYDCVSFDAQSTATNVLDFCIVPAAAIDELGCSCDAELYAVVQVVKRAPFGFIENQLMLRDAGILTPRANSSASRASNAYLS